MKAARISAFGGYEQITIEDQETPAPQRGQVLVRIAAAGVGPWDGWILAGKSALPQPLPLTLGADFAGEIVGLGEGVAEFKIGERVFGVVNSRFTGAWAQYAVATAAMVARAPKNLSEIEAASAPIVATTAWQGLFVEAGIRAEDRVLILGAAGSVGAYAVQMARNAGVTALATATGADEAFVRGLGAAEVVDARAPDFVNGMEDLDAVLDLVGGEPQRRVIAALKRGGKLISAVSRPDESLAAAAGVDARFFLVETTSERLTALAAEFEAGRLVPQVGGVFPLSEARFALARVEGGKPRTRGKIVLQIP